jgi:hypothetical protein
MELFGMVAIQLAQDLDHIGVSIGTTKGVASAIETNDELCVLIRSDRFLYMRTALSHFEDEIRRVDREVVNLVGWFKNESDRE